MWRIRVADLRDSWPAWGGVSLAFVTANYAFATLALIINSGFVAVASGGVTLEKSAGFTVGPLTIVIMMCFVASTVIGAATALVITARRSALARLALAGATPAQVRGVLMTQLTAVSLASAAAADVLALVTLTSITDYIVFARAGQGDAVVPPIHDVAPLLLANAGCLLVALFGGARQLRRASEIPPVAALREAQLASPEGAMTRGRWVGVAALAGLVAAFVVAVPVLVARRDKETFSNLLVLDWMLLFVSGALLAALAPVLVGGLTRWWTGLIPWRAPSWRLARATVGAKADRLVRSVTPVMFTIGITLGDQAMGASLLATLDRSGLDIPLSNTGWESFLMIFGLPFLVALAGSVGVLVMMSKQRDAELALAGIVGATPGQRLILPALEAVIITGTAALLALGMVVPTLAYQAYAFTALGLAFAPAVPWGPALVALAAGVLVTAAATVLPTLPALRQSEPRVIARLVAQ